MSIKQFLTLLIFFLLSAWVKAQDSTVVTAPVDTLNVVQADSLTGKNGIPILRLLKKKDGLPNPKVSLILSLAVPGTGQVYNGKWWKAPLVYGALIGCGFWINNNTNNYLTLRDAYKRKQRDLTHIFSGTRLDDAGVLKSLRDRYDKQRQISYAVIVVAWLINGIEAFTDAHLMNFDVSDDLSLRLQPSAQSGNLGMGLVLSFDK